MEITIHGCRGSIPVSYPEIERYGGDTTCLEIRADDTAIILDAGSGIRKLHYLPDTIREAHLFITHLHWDHIIGFPHWTILWARPDLTLHIYGLERSHDNFYRALERSMSEPLYTHDVGDIPITFQYHELNPSQGIELGTNVHVSCTLANHPYRALAYRVQHGDEVLAFVPDTAPFDRYLFADDLVKMEQTLTPEERNTLIDMEDNLINLMGDATWLLYDAALTPAEYEMLPHWGHSTMAQAVEMARASSVKELVFFHHDPKRTDSQIDALLAEQRRENPDMTLSAAYTDMRISAGKESA